MARLFCRHLSWLWLGWIPRAHRVSSPVRPQRGRRRMLSPPSTISWCYYGGGRPAKPSQAKQSPGTLCHMSSKVQTTLLSVPWGLASAWLSCLALGLGGLQVDYGVILFWFCSNPVLLFCVFMSLRMSPARETHSQEVSLDICCFRKVCLSLLIFCCGSQCDSG